MNDRLKGELRREIEELLDHKWPRAKEDAAAPITSRRLQLASASRIRTSCPAAGRERR